MPVEESGNMLILCDAIAHADGNADFVAPWWPQLTEWAKYLEKYGLDPQEQLCTDDFMGHLAHNANLSVKAILGLAAYGDLCRMRGDNRRRTSTLPWPRPTPGTGWRSLPTAITTAWPSTSPAPGARNTISSGTASWGSTFSRPRWPKEVPHCKKMMLRYGLPLDSRTHLTKTDWSFWSATLAENQADFEALIAPTYDYLNATTARDPLADSYQTDNARSGGMHARPVVGGLFIKMLSDRDMWKKWASRDKLRPAELGPAARINGMNSMSLRFDRCSGGRSPVSHVIGNSQNARLRSRLAGPCLLATTTI